MLQDFTFKDMSKIKRPTLGDKVPLELFRAIRLIGMYQGLPMNGRGTTMVVGRKIGESLPVTTIDEFLKLFRGLNIGIPSVIHQDDSTIRIAVDDCFCEGLPIHEGKHVCDLEGAIMEGAIGKILNKTISSKEYKCNINGDDRCEYELKIR